MDKINNYNTESLVDICRGIEVGNIVLPEFQRDFVWDVSRTYDLFDSLIKDVFIGSIIYGIPSFEITIREIDIRPRITAGKRRKKLLTTALTREQVENKVSVNNLRLVLDGQQRLTAIYRALKGYDNIWFAIKNDDELIDELDDFEFKDLNLDQLVSSIDGKQDSERLSIKLSDAYIIKKDTPLQKEIETLYFNKLDYVDDLQEEDKERALVRYLQVANKIGNLLTAEKLLSYFMLKMDTEKFALFFERSNSRGITLNFIDILVAKLYSGFNLRGKINELEEKFPNYDFNREIIARTIAYFDSTGKKVDKNYILSSLDYTHFNKYWDTVCYLYKSVIDFLFDNKYIISQNWMSYPNTTIPLMAFLNELPQKSFSQMNESQKQFIDYWYWSSVLSQRYISSSNEMIVYDSNMLVRVAKNFKISDRYFFHKLKPAIEDTEDIKGYNRKGSAIYMGILNFINFASHGLLDFNNSNRISLNSQIEDHHIFPGKYLKNSFDVDSIEDTLIDCVANRTLIPKITNIKIGAKKPSEYLQEIEKKNPNLNKSLTSHLIPQDTINGLYDDFYEDFLLERSKLILNHIELLVNSKKKFLENTYYEPIRRITNVITIFGKYHKKTVEASFNIDTGKVLYKGESFSVSTSADIAKQDLTGKDDASTNGWKWWRYIDSDDGQEKFIDDFR